MDAAYWEAAGVVLAFVRAEGSSERVVAYHERGVRQLAEHLESNGLECTEASVSAWLEQGSVQWSNCKFKENRTAASRLLEALDTGRVSPSRYSHPGPTDYSKLSGWALAAVDRYVSELAAEGLTEGVLRVARMHAAQLLVETGIAELASPTGITPEAILSFATVREGAKTTRCSRLSHARGLLSSMVSAGQAEPWAPMLAEDRFACHAACYTAPPGWDGSPGATAGAVLAAANAVVGQMREARYSTTVLKSTAKCLDMLYIALALNGEPYSAAKARAWLESVAPEIGGQVPMYRRALDHLESLLATGRIDPDGMGSAKGDPLGKLPPWARDGVAAYLDLRRREGCAKSTLDATRNAAARLASFADEAGCGSWADLDASLVATWCVEDHHETAEGRLCYVAKARGLLDYLADEGLARLGLSIAARAESAPRRRVADVLSDAEVNAAEAARAAAETPMELRDAAIVALGLTMGLRARDVAELEMARISWSQSSVTIVQRKTLRQLELPLSTQAGNAIVAYLRRGRPESASPRLFVKHRAPYGGVTKSACRDAMLRTFGPGRTDFHCLRRTFATMMLRGGSDRRGVAEALGHATAQTVGEYLSLDPGRMRLCAIPLSSLGLGVAR